MELRAESYLAWVSREEVQEKLLAELDRLAEEGPRDELYGLGICAHLEDVVQPWAYAFVATHSGGYNQFFPPYVSSKYKRWEGPNREYRQEWCRQLAAALRADRSLFLLPPTKFALTQ